MAGLAALGTALYCHTLVCPLDDKKVAGTLRVPSAIAATTHGAYRLLWRGRHAERACYFGCGSAALRVSTNRAIPFSDGKSRMDIPMAGRYTPRPEF